MIHPLVTAHANLISSEAEKYSQHLPKAAVEAEAYEIANEAAKSFDPKSGNKFSTHLVSQLKQLSRLSTKYGNIARLPEKVQYDLNTVNKYKAQFHDEHGRDPSVAEIAEHTHFPIPKIRDLLQGARKVANLSGAASEHIFSQDNGTLDNVIHFVYHDLAPRDQLIFEHYTGFGGKPLMTEHEIAKKLNLSLPQVNRRISVISDAIAEGVSQT